MVCLEGDRLPTPPNKVLGGYSSAQSTFCDHSSFEVRKFKFLLELLRG